MRILNGWSVVAALLVVTNGAVAQQSQESPKPADLEPGVNTSAPPPADATSPRASADTTPPPKAPVAAAAEKAKSKASATSKPTAEPASKQASVPSKTDTPATAKAEPARKGGGKAEDHLQLDTTQITGNQELPKVLYIVPWKRSDLGDLLGKPANSLLDEVLEPVDRDVFKRQNRYYDALKPDTGAAGGGRADAASPTSGDKH